MRDGLLPRMEARPWASGGKTTYRYHPVGGKPINLGTDLKAALRQVLDLNGETAHHGSLRWVFEQYQKSKRWTRLTDGTRHDYEAAWRQIDARLGHLSVTAITAPMVARYVHVDRAGSPRRADVEKSLMGSLFRHAITLGVGLINPVISVESHGSTPSTVMPGGLALKRFLAWLGVQHPQRQVIGRMAEFASLVGARRCEFLDLAWSQVDDAAGQIRLPRAKQRGRVIFDVVAISPRLATLLAGMSRETPWVFTNRKGTPYREGSFNALWRKCLLSAIEEKVITPKQRFNFHALRRYYATMHRAEHGALPDLHSDPRITARVYDATTEVGRRSL